MSTRPERIELSKQRQGVAKKVDTVCSMGYADIQMDVIAALKNLQQSHAFIQKDAESRAVWACPSLVSCAAITGGIPWGFLCGSS